MHDSCVLCLQAAWSAAGKNVKAKSSARRGIKAADSERSVGPDLASFVGTWEMLGSTQVVTEKHVLWPDHKVTTIRPISSSAFTMCVDERDCEAHLEAGGQQLFWNDGSVWLRTMGDEDGEGTPLLGRRTPRSPH